MPCKARAVIGAKWHVLLCLQAVRTWPEIHNLTTRHAYVIALPRSLVDAGDTSVDSQMRDACAAEQAGRIAGTPEKSDTTLPSSLVSSATFVATLQAPALGFHKNDEVVSTCN